MDERHGSTDGDSFEFVVDEELDRRHPERVQLREMRTADDFRTMWSTLEGLWSAAIERARLLPDEARHDQVGGEWSFVETLRHLVFATDAWASRPILGVAMPYHPAGLPHSSYPAADRAALGLELAARPSFDEALSMRAERAAVVRRVLDSLTDDELERTCAFAPTPEFPDHERFTVRECLFTVMEEECEHHRYAVRDLTALEARS